jgi:hypothetical protein
MASMFTVTAHAKGKLHMCILFNNVHVSKSHGNRALAKDAVDCSVYKLQVHA